MRFWRIALAALVVSALTIAACRSPKKVLTERDKQQVKDCVLSEAPTGPDIVPVNVNFDDKVTLLSYSVNKIRAMQGETIALTLYWKSLAKVGGDFKVFVHLDSTRARKTYDHYAVAGLYPTVNWNPGEIIKDEMAIQLDEGFPNGPAKLWLGFFDAKAWKNEKANVRLSVKDAGACRADKKDRLLCLAFMVGNVEDKTVVVKKAGAPVSVDGKLDEPGWRQALVDGGAFYATDGKPIPATEKVEAGMLFDDENLYLAFKVKDKDLQTPYTSRDSTLWSGGKRGAADVTEIFFDPDADGKNYLELQLSPAGIIFDAVFDSYRNPAWKKASAVNLDFKHQVVLDGTLNDKAPDQGYTVEVAIPWKELPGLEKAPDKSRRFSINFFRLSNSGTWAAAWSPVGNDFHDMLLAGRVTFGQ